jgi:hypothetical protein
LSVSARHGCLLEDLRRSPLNHEQRSRFGGKTSGAYGEAQKAKPRRLMPRLIKIKPEPQPKPTGNSSRVIASAAAEEELTRIRGGRMSEEYRGHLIRT